MFTIGEIKNNIFGLALLSRIFFGTPILSTSLLPYFKYGLPDTIHPFFVFFEILNPLFGYWRIYSSILPRWPFFDFANSWGSVGAVSGLS